MISKRRLIGSAISTLVAAGFIFQAAPSAISKTEHNGTTVVEERIDNKPYQVAHVIVKARPEQVWQIITDFRNATNIFPTVKQCQIVADKGTTKIVHYQMKPTGCLATFQYDLEMKEIPHRMLSWRRLGGDFKNLEGYWKLEPTDCGTSTLVTYATHVNGGMLMPQALIKHQSHVDVPQAMAALKNHAETTMRIAAQGSHSTN